MVKKAADKAIYTALSGAPSFTSGIVFAAHNKDLEDLKVWKKDFESFGHKVDILKPSILKNLKSPK